MLEVDGSLGEGGGQILRTALALSMCTQQAVRIRDIRAKRSKPGLMRQHLTAVKAAADICGGTVQGASVGSSVVEFRPGPVRAGDYAFDIGTAGSCTLVLQTVLPPLLTAPASSTVRISGGTHNPAAPPMDFLQRAFLPLLCRMGATVDLELKRFGFFPKGGGQLLAQIAPASSLQPLVLMERGDRTNAYAEAYVAALPLHIAERELAVVGKLLNWRPEQLILRGLPNDFGPGNALTITLEYAHVAEVYTGFGERGVAAETVARRAAEQARDYLAGRHAVGLYLADQLLLPLALAGGGAFSTCRPTAHFLSNAAVIEQLTNVRIRVIEREPQYFDVTVG